MFFIRSQAIRGQPNIHDPTFQTNTPNMIKPAATTILSFIANRS